MKLNKLFTILMAAAVVLGCAGCKNDLTLAEKLVGTGGSGASGGSGESEELYKLDFYGMNIYFGYNKTTCKITNAWLKPSDLDLDYTLYIPSSSHHDELFDIDEGEDASWGRSSTQGQLLLQIIAESSSTAYRVDYFEISTSLVEYGFQYIDNITTAFPNKTSPILPAANISHDLFYLKSNTNDVYIYDLTNNTVSLISNSGVSSTDNQIVITGDPITLNTKPKTEFPEMTTAVRVSNPCSHQIVVYDDINESLQVGKVPLIPTNKESASCAPLYKSANDMYFARRGL